MSNKHKSLIVICGPTATGKSGLALNLAIKLESIIISADSRQVYQEFNIGTAKPTLQEQVLVPHYLIDICDPTEKLTVAEYQQKGNAIIDQFCQNAPPLLVGGTGLYLKSIVKGMKIPPVSPQAELRQQLQAFGQQQCYQFLLQVDPVAASRIHAHDAVRTLRALEVYYVTGQPISAQQKENPPTYPILYIGLHCDIEQLRQRITQRTYQMIKQGWVEEVQYLIKKYGEELSLLNTLGYREIKQYLKGETSLEKAIELTIIQTSQFAKRQRTWFQSVAEIEWFDANSSQLWTQIWQRVQFFLKN